MVFHDSYFVYVSDKGSGKFSKPLLTNAVSDKTSYAGIMRFMYYLEDY